MLGVDVVFIFFFQAEDGIRDLVRSRGLGDVYKRQGVIHAQRAARRRRPVRQVGVFRVSEVHRMRLAAPVSYTHLTLPTSDLV